MARYYRGFTVRVPAYLANQMTSPEPKRNPYRACRYLVSAHHLRQLPVDEGFEVAFAGRSNAGKSSAINTLTGQKALARTSKTPGRTQQIVIFELDAERRIADLPGYGYAKVPHKIRDHWRRLMQAYFDRRRSLRGGGGSLPVATITSASDLPVKGGPLDPAQGASVPARRGQRAGILGTQSRGPRRTHRAPESLVCDRAGTGRN